uniref:B-related factor 1 n=1 Tax=Bracon brevicornis TaxID=1563983 RepID=A0A6V7JZB6_9HYME
MSSNKCKNCGSTEIETDPARGDAVCTQCGFVLEDQLIVSETTFEETSSGNMTIVGQFVASDSTGAATGFGASYHVNGKESREITIQNARKGISHLCQQLRLNQRHIETSVNFYKMALSRNLTRGRKQVHNHAACVYMTCRTEETPHLLIDISDILQIDVHELGRTYLKFSNALCINIPSMDPCLFIMKYALKLEFGDKTNEVSNTAQRLLQRMMRDSIHSGRRPSGLCGAALLIAARLHEFNRTPHDIIKIVKVHESTLRKRLIEFGDTPSSALTLDEFMTVDLEEEQDPPAFKAARKKDRERLQRLENIDNEFDDLQNEIDRQLEELRQTKGKRRRNNDDGAEEVEADRFAAESTMNIIQSCLNPDDPDDPAAIGENPEKNRGLGPDISSMGIGLSLNETDNAKRDNNTNNSLENEIGEIDLTDLDDEEIDSYIMSEKEANMKCTLWNKVNQTYLEQQKEKEEKRLKEIEEGKPEKKKRKVNPKKKQSGPAANTASEAIEKMLQEKRISSKINYEVLKSLNVGATSNLTNSNAPSTEVQSTKTMDNSIPMSTEMKSESMPVKLEAPSSTPESSANLKQASVRKIGAKVEDSTNKNIHDDDVGEEFDECEDDVEEEVEVENEMSMAQMLQTNDEDDDNYGYDYDDEEY